MDIQIEPSETPIQDRLKKAYIDKFNTLMVSNMTPEQIKYHIADLEDTIKVLQTQLQATLDVDEEHARSLSVEQRETLRAQDKKYRAKARPALNSDGTLKISKVKSDKVEPIGDSGTQAFENLVAKLMTTGMSRDKAIKLIQSEGK